MKLKLTALAFIVLLLTSCNHSNFEPDGKVIIAGKILNFEKHNEDRNLDIVYQGIFELQDNKFVKINDDGSFQTTIPCHYKKDFFIRFNRISAIYICEPNDSIFITLDADILNDPRNKYPNDSYFAKVIGGSRVEDIELVNIFWQKSWVGSSSSDSREAIKKYSPMDYYNYQNNLEQSKISILDSLISSSPFPTKMMSLWAKDHLKYLKLKDLLSYAFSHPLSNNSVLDSFNIPDEYFTQILNEDINTSDIFSFGHLLFLRYYNSFLNEQAIKEGVEIPDYIKENANGISKDIALAKYYYGINEKSDTLVTIQADLITNKYIKNQLTSEVDLLLKKKLELLKGNTSSKFLDSLVTKYKDKVLYIDFWATWCGACMNEMNNSKPIQEKYKEKPVEFLFLCNQSTKESWQYTIEKKEFTGIQILLNDEQYAELKDLFKISTIPHYVIINKKGSITNNAPRPSDKNFENKINELLNE